MMNEDDFKKYAWELYKLIPNENKEKFKIFMFHEAGKLSDKNLYEIPSGKEESYIKVDC